MNQFTPFAHVCALRLLALFILPGTVKLTAQVNETARSKRLVADFAVGVGYGRGFAVLKVRDASFLFPGPKTVEIYSSPVLTFDAHTRVEGKFSLGIAVSYQSIRTGIAENNKVYDYGFLYERLNFGFRPLFVFPLTKHVSMHTGARLGYTVWKESTIYPSPIQTKPPPVINMPSLQVIGGIRCVFGRVGIGCEFGFGTAPYLAQVHWFYRIGKLSD